MPKVSQQTITQQQDILSSDRTTWTRPFQVVGTDYAVQSFIKTRIQERKSVHTSIQIQFNKSNSFINTARSNHRWVYNSIEEINWKSASWNKIFRKCKDVHVAGSKWITMINNSEILHQILVKQLGGVDSLRERSLWWKTYCIKQLGGQS